jgi:isoleucyl-tRNA synthetase
LTLDLQSDEDNFVVYKAVGENRAMGQAFGKKFDKKAKAAIESLSSDQIRVYLKNGSVDVNGLNVTTGMLKISKDFNTTLLANPTYACTCSDDASVMLNVETTEELQQMGMCREVVNRIQRLRKTSGISIDD